MTCPKCKITNNIDVMVDITVSIPAEKYRHLSKRDIRLKDIRLWGADWDHCSFICPQCYYTGDLKDFTVTDHDLRH